VEKEMKINFLKPQANMSPIWIVELGQVKLGVASRSNWQIELQGDVAELSKPEDMTLLLPLLEENRNKIYEHLREVDIIRPDFEVQSNFPEKMLLQCAFEFSVSDYWPLKALVWLDSVPELIDVFKVSLTDLQKRSWATQPMKHKIRLMLSNHKFIL
jgi:hypothetical protein